LSAAAIRRARLAPTQPDGEFHFSRATTTPEIVLRSTVAGTFLDWTRRGAMRPMVQSAVRPELRSTAMALTEFVNGALASVVIILFGRFADPSGLFRALLFLTTGLWAIAFLVTPLYYVVFPKDAARWRDQMRERRSIITGHAAGQGGRIPNGAQGKGSLASPRHKMRRVMCQGILRSRARRPLSLPTNSTSWERLLPGYEGGRLGRPLPEGSRLPAKPSGQPFRARDLFARPA
jgi:hypothetical protein